MATVSSDIPPEWVEALDEEAGESFAKRSQIIRKAIGLYLRGCGRLPITTMVLETPETADSAPEPVTV